MTTAAGLLFNMALHKVTKKSQLPNSPNQNDSIISKLTDHILFSTLLQGMELSLMTATQSKLCDIQAK